MSASTSGSSQHGDAGSLSEKSGSFPVLLAAGAVLGIVAIVVCFATLGTEFGIPLVILAVTLLIAALGFRMVTGRSESAAASEEGGLPKQPLDSDRPLGDTTEAHDEINPHDLPLDNPGRHMAQRMAAGSDGTTRGNTQGGAAGAGGGEEDDQSGMVGTKESGGADPGRAS